MCTVAVKVSIRNALTTGQRKTAEKLLSFHGISMQWDPNSHPHRKINQYHSTKGADDKGTRHCTGSLRSRCTSKLQWYLIQNSPDVTVPNVGCTQESFAKVSIFFHWLYHHWLANGCVLMMCWCDEDHRLRLCLKWLQSVNLSCFSLQWNNLLLM